MFPNSCLFLFVEREAGDQAEVGISVISQTAEGHHPGMSGGLCHEHHWEGSSHVRPQ